MIIDKSVIADGIKPAVLDKLIQRHERETERYSRLKEYYRGNQAILTRTKKSESAANNRLVSNHAKYIVDITQAYLIGNPVTYSASEGIDIEAVKNAYLEQDIQSVDTDIEKVASICGRAYELVYANETPAPRSVMLSPENTFVCYDNTAVQKPLFGVYYYKRYDLDGNVTGIVCDVYDSERSYRYTNTADNWLTMTLEEEPTPHYFGGVPVIEYKNNADCQGDFEQLISLIDAYNILQSDRVNDKEQFVDAFLFLKCCEIDNEQAQKLKEEKILMGYEEADAKYLSKVLTEEDVKVLRDDLKEDIHRFSMVPDLTDDNFGNNLSGVAIKYKLLGFEQHVKNKERYFANGLKKRFMLYNYFLNIQAKAEIVPIHRVDIIFTRNLPENELETAQMISYLTDIVSNETLLEQLSFVSDAKEEQKLVDEEKEKKNINKIERVKELAAGGGY